NANKYGDRRTEKEDELFRDEIPVEVERLVRQGRQNDGDRTKLHQMQRETIASRGGRCGHMSGIKPVSGCTRQADRPIVMFHSTFSEYTDARPPRMASHLPAR